MRLSHYFMAMVLMSVTGLMLTALSGIQRWPAHLSIALPSALVVGALHSMVILFVLIGSRLLREASRNCGLSPEYLMRNNAYFRDVTGLFLSLAAAAMIVLAAVLGFASHAFGLPPGVHLCVALIAALTTLAAIPIELRVLRRVERLLDTAREVLATSDRERAQRGLAPVDADVQPRRDSHRSVRLFVVIAPWLAYLYQALIVWSGDFSQVSLHPWIEISGVGLVMLAPAIRVPHATAGASNRARPEPAHLGVHLRGTTAGHEDDKVASRSPHPE